MSRTRPEQSIALYSPNLKGGGAERMMLILAGALIERGYRVDLLLDQKEGAYIGRVPAGVRVRELVKTSIARGVYSLFRKCRRDRSIVIRHVLTTPKVLNKLRGLLDLVDYLETHRPLAIICALGYTPFLARWARDIAGVPTRVIARQDNSLSVKFTDTQISREKRRKREKLRHLMVELYPEMDAIAAVSCGVREDLARTLDMPRELITTVYNPVISPDIQIKRREAVTHPWFAVGQPPVVLAVGRLNVQKGFEVLLQAFAAVRKEIDARLVIIGEGPQRGTLEAKIRQLDIEANVDLPGWSDNPYPLMANCSVFVLSSRYEGLPTSLIEAMACGCPVVTTDCPNGPREILLDGSLGTLVPVGDASRLAQAIVETLQIKPDTCSLQARATAFSVEASTRDHIDLINRGL